MTSLTNVANSKHYNNSTRSAVSLYSAGALCFNMYHICCSASIAYAEKLLLHEGTTPNIRADDTVPAVIFIGAPLASPLSLLLLWLWLKLINVLSRITVCIDTIVAINACCTR